MNTLKIVYTILLVVPMLIGFPLSSLATENFSPQIKKNNPDPGHIKRRGGDPARGGETEIWVYPRNKSPKDATNIQWAVNNVVSGGSVFLMATDPDELEPKPFFFGYGTNGDRVILGKVGNDVNIIGQTQLEYDPSTDRPTGDIIGIPTVIKGGHNTFVSGATGEDINGVPGTNVFGDRTPKINLKVEGIVFEECFEMCVWIPGSTGFEISGNKFVKPRLLEVDEPHPLGHSVFFGLGPDPGTIEWVRQNVFELPPANVTDHDVSGEVLIRGNYVQGEAFSSTDLNDFGPDDYPVLFDGTYYSGASNGLGYSEGVDALVVIENNTIDTFLSSGIYGTSNKGSEDNTTIVRNNLILQGHHGWWRYALYGVNLKSGDFQDNNILDTDGVIWIENTSGVKYSSNSVKGVGQKGIVLYGNSSDNLIDIQPEDLDEFYPTEFHIKLYETSNGNTVNLNGTTGLIIIDEGSNNTINP
jgi:hypothetical protein